MTEKTVYCSISNRMKKITFHISYDCPEVQSMRQEFLNVAYKDSSLKKLVENKDLVFQTKDKNYI